MNGDNKRENLKRELKKTLKRERTRNYIILYSVILIIFLALLGYSFYNGYFSKKEFIVNIVNNIIGILPPLLIFDFFNEKLTRDSSALEMSNQITETLMSNPEALELFSEEQRKTLVDSTVASIVKDEDRCEMISSTYSDYLMSEANYRIRTEFAYDIELHERMPQTYDIFKDREEYFYVQEKLQYKVKYAPYAKNNLKSNIVKIGLAFGNECLDNALREKDGEKNLKECIFREILDVTEQDIAVLRMLEGTKEEIVNQLQQLFKFDLRIDNLKGELEDIAVSEAGIVASFHVGHDISLQEHSVRILFHMPKQWGSVMEVAIIDPTKAPKISVSYTEDAMRVEMYSFLSKGEESSLEVAHEQQNGLYDIILNKEWIFPISGLLFKIDRKRGQ